VTADSNGNRAAFVVFGGYTTYLSEVGTNFDPETGAHTTTGTWIGEGNRLLVDKTT